MGAAPGDIAPSVRAMNPLRRSTSPVTPDAIAHRLDLLAGQWLRPTTSGPPQREGEPGPADASQVESAAADAGPGEESSDQTSIGQTSIGHDEGRRRLVMPDRSSLRAVLLIAVLVALVIGWMWWQGRPRPVVQAPAVIAEGTSIASESGIAGQVVVHVTGAVAEPGVIRLPAGSRVDDAITAAGGAKSPKALASVNLARVLVDGEQIVVGAMPAGSGGGGSGTGIDLNQASAGDLEALPGIGPVLAQRIVDWRTTNGPFRSIDELGEVSGIGDALLAQIRSLARV